MELETIQPPDDGNVAVQITEAPDVETNSTASVLSSPEVGPSGSPPKYPIFRVHKKLREVNEKAYEPNIVSIGPYHRGKPSLQMMEVQKLRYLQLFLAQSGERDAQRYIDALRPLEEEARRCYAEYVRLEPDEFVEMMLRDSLFIIEVILRFSGETITAKDPAADPNDPIFKMQWMVNSLQRDLMLFENQLPLFVLIKVLNTGIIPFITPQGLFFEKALRFFNDLLPSASDNLIICEDNPWELNHLLELVHRSWPPFSVVQRWHNSGQVQERASRGFIPSTTELQEAGVKLKASEGSLFNIKFEGGVVRVPSLTIEDRTETFFRNLIAYEQYRPSYEPSPFTDYVRFLDCLIDTPKDVQILSRLGIIKNWLGDDEDVSTMFNKISEAIVEPRNSFQYVDIFTRVNGHCNRKKNKWMAILKRDYFNSPWALISVLAAVVLLFLGFIQTVFTIFPRH